MVRSPEYCTVKNVADWLRIPINKNTDPNTSMVEEFIMDNEDEINRETGHSWLTKNLYSETFDVSDIYDYGHGMALLMKHRQIKDWDEAEGDKLEIWNGIEWALQTVSNPDIFVNFDQHRGTMFIRGYIYTILRKARFRVTYRYGGVREVVEGQTIPRDISKACKLMTCIDILSTDFQMSQIKYGGEGNVDKGEMMDKWQKKIDKIIWNHSEMLTVY